MPLSVLLSTLVPRSVPVIASVMIHGAVATGLVAAAGGHSRAAPQMPAATAAIDVETTEAPLLVPDEVQVKAPPRSTAPRVHTHTHAEPVPPSHDDHPHDPSLRHAPAPGPVRAVRSEPAINEPAAAAPALTAEGPAPLPRFTLASGAGANSARIEGIGAGASGMADVNAGPSDDTIHAASAVQVPARLVKSVIAAYPLSARADEVEGDVGVEIVVDREGLVVDARVTRSGGPDFDAAALAAVRGYRFSPAQRAGRAVRVRMPWSVQFRLR